jgi:Na+/H+ antiporter NhaD/arsenite permease-like protein
MDDRSQHGSSNDWGGKARHFIRLNFPVNYVTGPLIVNIFLLASSAIGQKEVHDGIIGTNRISPIDIMLFFLSLTYIAISLDASGLFRWIIFRVLQQGGVVGHKLFLYLYAFFFGLASFIGNNLVILSSTASVVYLTRISSNIIHPRAWIHTQFAAANIGSAILATSNPTNLVLVSAFNIKFFHYTANMIVPVIATAIFLSPVLLYVIFANEALIPLKMEIYEIPKEAKAKRPINPNIPYARGVAGDDPDTIQKIPILSAEEIINPFLDKASALFGALIMAASLTTLLALNTATAISEEHPVFWVVLPAALILFSWDVSQGWFHRNETREIAYQGRLEIERFRAEQEIRQREELRPASEQENENPTAITVIQNSIPTQISDDDPGQPRSGRLTLVSLLQVGYTWAQETFPAATAVLALLPVSLIPFTFCMFVLIQALVTKGWILVFAHGWENWVNKTGTMGAIGGMGFLSVILCNVSLSSGLYKKQFGDVPELTSHLTKSSSRAQILEPPFFCAA